MSFRSAGYNFALVIGGVTTLIGLLAVIWPEQMSKKFGIGVSGLALPYVVSTGIRDVFDWTALGMVNICIGVVALSDFLVVRKHGDKKTALVHLVGAIVVVKYGIWLLYV